jgi:hypothetical protein
MVAHRKRYLTRMTRSRHEEHKNALPWLECFGDGKGDTCHQVIRVMPEECDVRTVVVPVQFEGGPIVGVAFSVDLGR